MLKQILPLLFILIFSINLFAESHDIHKDILDIKLQIQEIKLTDARDEREKKIENLEKDIKELEEKFNQNNVDKKEIDGKLEKTKDIIERQDLRLDDLNFYLALYGFLITILLFVASYLSYRFTSSSASKIVQNWIKENKEEILEPIRNEAKDLQKNIEKQALSLYQEQLKEFRIEDKLDESQKKNQKLILEKVNEILEKKEKNEYTFDDWYSKFLNLKNDKNHVNRAIYFLEKALIHATTNEEKAKAIFNKALFYGNNISKEESIKIYDELIEKFNTSSEQKVLEFISISLYNKANEYGRLKEYKKSLITYNKLIEKFQNSQNNYILAIVLDGLINKLEINLFQNIENDKNDIDLVSKLIINDNSKLLQIEMLKIIKKGINQDVDEEVKDWKIKFKDMKFKNWSFNELKTWAETLEGEVKERILKYIDIFENHNKNIDGK
ncbi:MAG: hypothetical protein PHY66_09350 [Aliarcobacter sp.]|nr:hypothetical protein [Aliarcobacter sp.]